jgi:hypothetical protein
MLRVALTFTSLAVVCLTAAPAIRGEAQYLSLQPSDLPPPPRYFTHRVLPTVDPEPESPRLRLNVQPLRSPVTTRRASEPLAPAAVKAPSPVVEPRRQVVRKAPPMDRVVNPFPLLLADSTLRPGDIVVFPDGPRMFTGSPGTSHSVREFETFATAGKKIPQSVRETLTKIRAGVNEAWAYAALRDDGKLKERVAVNPYAQGVDSFDELLRSERRGAQRLPANRRQTQSAPMPDHVRVTRH